MKFIRLITSIALLFLLKLPIFSLPEITGSADTTVYVYSSENNDFSETETKSKISEALFLNITFLDDLSFYTNNRFNYWTSENDNPDRYELNLYYGYFDYNPVSSFSMQLGRIMDLSNLLYSIYDGSNLEFIFSIKKVKLTVDFYGGLVVNDDYLDNDSDPYGYNSYDYRNIFNFDKISVYHELLMKERKGDYIFGSKTDVFFKKIGVFTLEYQTIYNQYDLAAHNVSLDFDTFFSKNIIFYGYCIFDLIDEKPSSTLETVRLNYSDFLSVIVKHEYFRPVYLKDSYFWTYFEPYGYQQMTGNLIFSISPAVKLDLKYGKLFYDATDDTGDEFSAAVTHRNIFNTSIEIAGNYCTGPEGDMIQSETTLNRRFSIVDVYAGLGVIYYSDTNLSHTMRADYFSDNYNEIKENFDNGYFAMLEACLDILKNLNLTATAEYHTNPKYHYDIRGILSLEYIF